MHLEKHMNTKPESCVVAWNDRSTVVGGSSDRIGVGNEEIYMLDVLLQLTKLYSCLWCICWREYKYQNIYTHKIHTLHSDIFC